MRQFLVLHLLFLFLSTVLFSGCAGNRPMATGGEETQDQRNASSKGAGTSLLPPAVTTINGKDLEDMIEDGKDMILVDCRSAEQYAEAHLPGAINRTSDQMGKDGKSSLPGGKNLPLIFYFGGPGCSIASRCAVLAQNMGYEDIRVYQEGPGGWRVAGFPLDASTQFVGSGNAVLIDLRSNVTAQAGHLPGAVNMRLADLDNTAGLLPAKAPLVLYGSSRKEAVKALAILRKKGYARVSLLPGDYGQWVREGRKVVSGPLEEKISWKPKLTEEEVSREDFLKAVNGGQTAVLLDVRTREEVAEGKLQNAIAIPLDALDKRMKELPKDKPLYVYCSSGARAELAAGELRRNTFNARFLKAAISCTGNSCTIRD